MTNTPSIGFRLPGPLVERLDRYAARLTKEAGVPITRAAAVVKLLGLALDDEERRKTSKR